ncbi:hypothetical protein K438DRAFT_1752502 [Mycena galopus ATCC 62051]|nr:hypothetical protein K438DRAFT_1752502 [Mycena galopus ATCC 62051]
MSKIHGSSAKENVPDSPGASRGGRAAMLDIETAQENPCRAGMDRNDAGLSKQRLRTKCPLWCFAGGLNLAGDRRLCGNRILGGGSFGFSAAKKTTHDVIIS